MKKNTKNLTVPRRNRREKEGLFFTTGGVASDLVVLNHDSRLHTKNVKADRARLFIQRYIKICDLLYTTHVVLGNRIPLGTHLSF